MWAITNFGPTYASSSHNTSNGLFTRFPKAHALRQLGFDDQRKPSTFHVTFVLQELTFPRHFSHLLSRFILSAT